jgi:hypothetical protein
VFTNQSSNNVYKRFCFLALFLLFTINLFSQFNIRYENNTFHTAANFLTVAPDGRGTGLGNAGAAISSDANAMYWNPARYGFINNWGGFSFSVLPYNLINHDNYKTLKFFTNEAGFARINKKIVLAATFRNQYWEEMTVTDDQGTNLGTFKPKEFSFDLAFAYLINNNLSLAIAGRYISSNLFQNQVVQGVETKVGKSFAMDVSVYWKKKFSSLITFAWGLNISNIGNKISYTTANINKNFIPTNLRLGGRLSLNFSDAVVLSFQLDMTKLLVPTPPVYAKDSTGNLILVPGTDHYLIAAGMNPDISIVKGMIQSWYDAPGDVEIILDENGNQIYDPETGAALVTVKSGSAFTEELKELYWGTGIELIIFNKLYVRDGFYYQHATKGGLKYFTTSVGGWSKFFCFDITYQKAIKNAYTYHNYKSLIRFTFIFRFGNPNHDYASKE